MFIAHLPSGYILAKVLQKKFKTLPIHSHLFITVTMLGAIFPDIDLFYFYLIDGRSVHHHQYFLHWFAFWIPLFFIAFFCFWKSNFQSKWAALASTFFLAALLHVFLDTFVGDVWLLAPFVMEPFAFFEVSARYQPWWLNFIFHWSFAVELVICMWALIIFIKECKSKSLS
ncbi:metal-dependent hydrolase [Acinetobacter equi]|uniref:Hydrolase n=1 Tax=Acinetobacter equi TaxID=1324350 RepID=A0A0N7GXJ9_9GAMM|nr:metal-dependent hydrolase [Acinetobacter equi]ALH94923.1 hydrolase [Acinetobacter equi]